MLKGIIYLIQPVELVGTNRYKIGCSNTPDLKRCNYGYKKGSRYICIMECNNPLELEKKIKDEFNKLFKLIGGREYFEGDETIMKQTFLKIIKKYDYILDSSENIIFNNSSDESESSNSDNELLYEITTYEDFLLTSDIEKIIIINRKLKYGYLKFNNPCSRWYEINEHEDLLGWIVDHNDKYTLCIDKKTNTLCRFDKSKPEKNITNRHKIIEYINYDFNKICDDICAKCYNKDIILDELNYYEYFVGRQDGSYCILDAKKLKIINHDDKIITNENIGGILYFNNFENINIDIVDAILNSLIIDSNILTEYKKLCYNIIVEQKQEIIFYDDITYPLLSNWLENLLNTISPKSIYNYDIDKDNIKLIKNNPKVIFIDMNSGILDIEIKRIINKVRKLGIKNIVVKNKTKTIYDYKSYIDFINYNKVNIIENAYNKERMEALLPIHDKITTYENIFYKKDLIFINYLKWCCS